MFAGKSIEFFSGGEAVGVVDCETIPKVSQACKTFMQFVFESSQEEKSIVINKVGACSCHIQRPVVLSRTPNLVTLQQGSQVLVLIIWHRIPPIRDALDALTTGLAALAA